MPNLFIGRTIEKLRHVRESKRDDFAQSHEASVEYFSKEELKRVEDFFYKETKIYTHRLNPFNHDLEKILGELGLKLRHLNSELLDSPNVWVRDYYYRGLDQTGKSTVYVVPDFKKTSLSSYISTHWTGMKKDFLLQNRRMNSLFYKYEVCLSSNGERQFLERECGHFAVEPRYFQQDRESLMLRELEILSGLSETETFPKVKSTSLEGGDLINAINQLGQMYFVVGESAIAHFILYEDLFLAQFKTDLKNRILHFIDRIKKHPTPQPHEEEGVSRRVQAKSHIGLELNAASKKPPKKNVIAIPQWSYHLDLQMSYLGSGRMLVHSFQETLNFLVAHEIDILQEFERLDLSQLQWQGSAQELYAELCAVNRLLVDEFEDSIVKETARKLEKHGFSVLKCPGILFFKMPQCGHVKGGILASFMNGVAGNSGEGQKEFFLTADSPLICFKNYFSELLTKNCGMMTKFLNVVNSDLEPDSIRTVEFIGRKQGSVRCLVNKDLV